MNESNEERFKRRRQALYNKEEHKMTDFTRENLLTAKNIYKRYIDIAENSKGLTLFEYDKQLLEFLNNKCICRIGDIDRILKREFEDDPH